MGTSGAYGGSGSTAWKQVHDLVGEMELIPPPSNPSQNVPTSDVPGPGDLAAAIARALRLASQAPLTWTPTSAGRPSRGRGTTTSRGGSTSRGSGGARSTASRAGAALTAGYAVASGDSRLLATADPTLRLDDLRSLSTEERCRVILDATLGPPGSPDDEVLRRASFEALVELSDGPVTDATPADTVQVFAEHYLYELAIRELTADASTANRAVDEIIRLEHDLRDYIRETLRDHPVTSGQYFGPAMFSRQCGDLLAGVITIFIEGPS